MEHFIDYTSAQTIPAEVLRFTTYGTLLIAGFATSKQSYATTPFLFRPGGTVVAVDVFADLTGAPSSIMVTRRLILWVTMKMILKEVNEALDFMSRGLVKPILALSMALSNLHDMDEMFDKIGVGQLAGRAVIKVSA